MLMSLEIFQSARSSAQFAAQQQAVVSKNIANSDTPGFRAMIVKLPELQSDPLIASAMKVSRSSHLIVPTDQSKFSVVPDQATEISPNGNSVSIEAETLKSIEAERRHARAITVYQSALNILRSSIGRGR